MGDIFLTAAVVAAPLERINYIYRCRVRLVLKAPRHFTSPSGCCNVAGAVTRNYVTRCFRLQYCKELSYFSKNNSGLPAPFSEL